MVFDENSALAKIWQRLILTNPDKFTIDSVPAIGNLREVVSSLLEG